MLTASDVEQKTFSTALRGYDLDEVDDFLDEIVATIKELNEQLEEARAARDGAVVTPVAPPEPEPLPEEAEPEPEPEVTPAEARPEIDESAIGRALVAAQTAADKLLEEAQSEATRIVDDARSEADSWSEERDAKRREAQEEMSSLAARVASVRSELAVLAGEVSGTLDDMDTVIEGAVPFDDGDQTDQEPADQAEEDEGNLSGDWDEGSGEDPPSDADTGTGEEAVDGSDHLDDILNGVANDLQWEGGGDEESEPEKEE